MTTRAAIEPEAIAVIGGVDTHKDTHYAAAVDDHGRLLGHHEFRANDRGYADLLSWVQSQGDVAAIGVESTGSFGATLTRFLTAHAVRVVEVNRPSRLARHLDGKSDRLDAVDRTSSARADVDGDPESQVRHGRGDPDAARDSLQRGQSPHQRLQHAEGPHDRGTLARGEINSF
jgi:transposase